VTHLPGQKLIAGAVTAAAVLAAAPAASADSIAFLRNGDAYLATTDGSREVRLTTGRTFNGITQSDDGRVFAVEKGVLYGYDRTGKQIGGPTAFLPMNDPDVSPDGTKLAFSYSTFDGYRYHVRNIDGSPAGWDDQNGDYASWIGNDLVLNTNGAGWIETTQPGLGGWNHWFSDPDGRKHDNAITRATDRLVVVVRDYDGTGPWSVAHYANSSPPPRDLSYGQEPPGGTPQLKCQQDFGPQQPQDPSFSPDGTRIAWELGDGVHVQPVYDLSSCTQPAGGFVIPGAKQPDWGPADVPATTGPPPPPEPPQPPPGDDGPLEEALVAPKGKLSTALKKGVKVTIRCSSPCTASGDLQYKKKVVAKGKKAINGKGTLVLKFTVKGKKQLKRLKKAKLAISVTAVDGENRASAANGSVTLKR
jgi:WD40-like Beta Propeller Repeat